MQGKDRTIYFYRNSPRPEDIRKRDELGAVFLDAAAWSPGDPIKSNVTAVAGYVPPGYQHLPRADAVVAPKESAPAPGAETSLSASRRGRRSTRTTSRRSTIAAPTAPVPAAEPESAASTLTAASDEPTTEPT
jgi:hypothetical protein